MDKNSFKNNFSIKHPVRVALDMIKRDTVKHIENWLINKIIYVRGKCIY